MDVFIMFKGILGIFGGIFAAFSNIFNGLFGLGTPTEEAGRGFIHEAETQPTPTINEEGQAPKGLSEPITIDGKDFDATAETSAYAEAKKAANLTDVNPAKKDGKKDDEHIAGQVNLLTDK